MMIEQVAIWVYGSYARGDTDHYSDYDILIIGPERSTSFITTAILERNTNKKQLSFSKYNWRDINRMVTYGSLFLHHIDCEGRIFWEGHSARGRLRLLLDSLCPYERIGQDLGSYSQAISDVRQSLRGGGSVPFELSVLATTLRHAAVLGCYVIGRPNFGRWTAVAAYAAHADLKNWTAAKIRDLLDYKLWSEGRRAAPEHIVLERSALLICEEVEGFVRRVEGEARWRGLITA